MNLVFYLKNEISNLFVFNLFFDNIYCGKSYVCKGKFYYDMCICNIVCCVVNWGDGLNYDFLIYFIYLRCFVNVFKKKYFY